MFGNGSKGGGGGGSPYSEAPLHQPIPLLYSALVTYTSQGGINDYSLTRKWITLIVLFLPLECVSSLHVIRWLLNFSYGMKL